MIQDVIAKARAKLDRHVIDIENRTDLTAEQKVNEIIVIFSTVCAAIAVQPIPFADIFILTPLQAYMGTRISAIRGLRLSEKETSDIIKEIFGVIGVGMIAQQLGIAFAKIFFPIFGGIATVPVVFGLTFAIGKVMDLYFIAGANGRKLSPQDIKDAWNAAKEKGHKEGERKQEEIKKNGLD